MKAPRSPSTLELASAQRPPFRGTEWESVAQVQASCGAVVTALWYGLWLAPSEREASWGARVFDILAPPGWRPTLGPQGSILGVAVGGHRVVFARDGGSFTPERWGKYEVRILGPAAGQMARPDAGWTVGGLGDGAAGGAAQRDEGGEG